MNGSIDVIPWPLSVQQSAGHFHLGIDTLLTYSSESLLYVAQRLQHQLASDLGYTLHLQQHVGAQQQPSLHLQLQPGIEELTSHPNSEEGYVLSVSPGGVVLTASTQVGLLYGGQTLKQLLLAQLQPSQQPQQQLCLPCVHIVDAPRFPWRGLLLDCGRHMFSVEFIHRVLDLMLLYKFNRFHWHICEDQGWRLEVKQLPRLTQFGAWRGGSEGACYGGFYTQDEVAAVVAYAAKRGITVVPEIEMPGHCVAALASYPHLSCTGNVRKVSERWGVHEDVYCGGKEEVFDFLEGVLQEVFQLFPSTYIHIGGDEVPKARWAHCPKCQQRIRDEGLDNEEELQAWFIERMNKFLRRHGRTLLGWDEILEGGQLPEGAVVISWRGIAGGVVAARAGHDVIMTPTSGCYFDYRQAEGEEEPGAWFGVLTLEQVYDFDPVPPEPPTSQGRAIVTAPHQQQPHPVSSARPMSLDGGNGDGQEEEEVEEGEEVTGGAIPSSAAAPGGHAVFSPHPQHPQQLQQGESGQQPEERGQGAGGSGAGGDSGSEDAAVGWPAGDLGLTPAVPPPPRPPPLAENAAAAGRRGSGSQGSTGSVMATRHAEGLVRAGLTLTPEEAKHILGGQANLWTEYVATEGVATYMLLPRLCAMSEALWTPRSSKNWGGFRQRLHLHEGLWRSMGLQYRQIEG